MRELEEKALRRVLAKDASLGEKAAAYLITNTMKVKRKLGMGMRIKKQKRKTSGGRIAFRKSVVNGVSKELKNNKANHKNVKSAAATAVKVARKLVKNVGGRRKIRIPRTIPIPKSGGVLPFLIPLFAGLSAVGGLTGGVAGVVKAVNAAQSAKKELDESQRHNKTMEAIALGKQQQQGAGLFLKPYKKGMGLFLRQPSKNLK